MIALDLVNLSSLIDDANVAECALVHTDEYAVYARLTARGDRYKTVCHERGEYARRG